MTPAWARALLPCASQMSLRERVIRTAEPAARRWALREVVQQRQRMLLATAGGSSARPGISRAGSFATQDPPPGVGRDSSPSLFTPLVQLPAPRRRHFWGVHVSVQVPQGHGEGGPPRGTCGSWTQPTQA